MIRLEKSSRRSCVVINIFFFLAKSRGKKEKENCIVVNALLHSCLDLVRFLHSKTVDCASSSTSFLSFRLSWFVLLSLGSRPCFLFLHIEAMYTLDTYRTKSDALA